MCWFLEHTLYCCYYWQEGRRIEGLNTKFSVEQKAKLPLVININKSEPITVSIQYVICTTQFDN